MKLKGKVIKSLLKQKGFSQLELGEYIQCTQAAVSKMLTRERTREDIAIKISEMLTVPLGSIAELDNGANPETVLAVSRLQHDKEVDALRHELAESDKRIKELNEMLKWSSETIKGLIEIGKGKNNKGE
jgi:transcriptional regulator with XRE-family HTH domain